MVIINSNTINLLETILLKLNRKEHQYDVGWELSKDEIKQTEQVLNELNKLNTSKSYKYELTKDYTGLVVQLEQFPYLSQIIPFSKITKYGIYYKEYDLKDITPFKSKLDIYNKESNYITEKMVKLFQKGELIKWEQLPNKLLDYLQELVSNETYNKWLYMVTYANLKEKLKFTRIYDMLEVKELNIYNEYDLRNILNNLYSEYMNYLERSLELAKFYNTTYINIYEELSKLLYGDICLIPYKDELNTFQFFGSYFKLDTSTNAIYFPHLTNFDNNIYTRSKCNYIYNTNKFKWKKELREVTHVKILKINEGIITLSTIYGNVEIDKITNTITYPINYPKNLEIPYISEFISLNVIKCY